MTKTRATELELVRFILENKKLFSTQSLTLLGSRMGFQLGQTTQEPLVTSCALGGVFGLCGYAVGQTLSDFLKEETHSPPLSKSPFSLFKKPLALLGGAIGLYLALNSGTLLASSGLRFAQSSLLTALWGSCGYHLGKQIDAKIHRPSLASKARL